MREKRTTIDKNHVFLKAPKDFDSIEFMINPMGIVFNATSKDELISKIKDYFPEEDTLLYNNPPAKRTIAVDIDRKNIENYIDGYSTISIVDSKVPSSIVVSGNEYEINRLISALSRNCIKVSPL